MGGEWGMVAIALKTSPNHLKSLFGYAHLQHSRRDYEQVRQRFSCFSGVVLNQDVT